MLTVKDNQPGLKEQIEHLVKEADPCLLYHAQTIDKDHRRLEEREIFALATHNTQLLIPGIKQVALLKRKREVIATGNKSEEDVYLISTMGFEQLNAMDFMTLKREYWGIENKLHYRKDFVFGEDRSTIRKKYGHQNMSTLRNFAIGLLSALSITNIKRCVENLQHDTHAILRKAAL